MLYIARKISRMYPECEKALIKKKKKIGPTYHSGGLPTLRNQFYWCVVDFREFILRSLKHFPIFDCFDFF